MPGARKNILGWDVAPFGFYKLLRWVHRRYQPSGGIVVTENGYPEHEPTADAARHDSGRICYLKTYLAQLARAMREGVDVRGTCMRACVPGARFCVGWSERIPTLGSDACRRCSTPRAAHVPPPAPAGARLLRMDPAR